MSKKRISRKNKGGDCYVVAGHFAMGDYRNIDFQGEPFVVHAEVLGQGAISGVRYGHAWVEDDVNVYDFSNNRQIVFPKDLYYAIGNVKTDNPLKYQKYTFEQARKKMLETGIYGCWDIQTEFAEGGTTTSKLKAPNGKPSNLNPEQWKLVRTPEFKAWFGDWENDPENASKVVDENGEPLVVYHGTYVENPFYIFDFNKADLGFHFGTYEQAKNRSETKLFFKNRKSVVNSFFLNIQNIYEMSDIGEWEYPPRYIDMLVSDGLISESDAKKNGFYRLFQREDNIQIREYLLAKYGKFIGFKYNNKYEGEGKSFIVLNPEQIKLADGSNTTFDGNNPDIRFAEGGTTNDEVDELYDIATRTFIGLGYDVTQGSNSKTDYGHSRYFYVNQDSKADVNSGLGFQVRVSDHSTGDRRILNGEQFIFDNNDVMVVFNRINYWFHPEEYNNVVAVKTKVVQIEVGENDLQPSDEIISERVAKSGNKRYTIKRTYKNEGIVPTHKVSGYKLPFKPNNPDIRFAEGGRVQKMIENGAVELKVYDTTPEHAKEYGLIAYNPLYIQRIFVNENDRNKGLGKEILQYLDKYAKDNGNDLIFGHIQQKANPSRVKSLLEKNGYTTIVGNNDFYKFVGKFAEGGTTTSKLKAPNGKPSNLTPEQWKLVRTPQFKAWFGDWENDPENASKVVDENGEPLVVYHGTNSDFWKFEKSKGKGSIKQKAINFSSNKNVSEDYGKRIIQCFLNLKKPIIKDYNGQNYHTITFNARFENRVNDIPDVIVNQAQVEKKYDGVIFLNIQDSKSAYNKFGVPIANNYYAFNNKQIKLADGSNTTFDGKNPDIRFAEGGTMNTIQQGDALIYKDSELLDFDNVIYVEHTEDTANGTLVSLSNGQTMFLPQVLKKFRKATEDEINRSKIMSKEIFSKGGKTKKSMKRIKRGGITYGKSHAEGGIPVKNESTGDMLEVEGGEGIVNKRSMASADKVTLNGKQMTICEAVSELNQMEGGVKFNCNDVEHRQFLEEMARGGELERGTRTENEHIQVLRDLYAKRITPKEATRKIAKDHLKEDSRYYSKLAKMEGKMAKGGEIYDDEGNLIDLKVGDRVIEFRQKTPNNPKSQIGSEGKIIQIVGAMAKIVFEPNDYEQWVALKDLQKMEGKMANGGTFNVKYDVTKKPDENNFYYIIYTESGKKVPSSNLPTDIGYGKLKNEFEAKRRKYDNSLGLQDAIFIAMKMNEADMKMAEGGMTTDNPFAEFGLIKDFKGDAFEKLDAMERVDTNYCEINKTNCSSTKGIDRKDMPQIYEEHIDEYIDFLDENGVTHSMERGVEVGKLKPTQANISVPRIKKILTRLINGYYTDTYGSKLNPLSRRLLATKDGFILDGHHRWASLLFLSPKNKIDVFRINADINDIIQLSKKFDLVAVSEFAYGGKVDVKVPNYTSDLESDINTTIIKRGGFPQAGLYFRPYYGYSYDLATLSKGAIGYSNEMLTLEVGTRNFTEKRTYNFSYALVKKLEYLSLNEPKYENYKDLKFFGYYDVSYDALQKAKKQYDYIQKNGNTYGIDPTKIVVIVLSYGRASASLDVNIYTPPALDYLTQGEEFFDFIFDAVNLLSKEPNKNTEASKKLAKEENIKRKEAQKGEQEKIVKSTEFPKEITEFNPRHLYRFKTATELELQYNTTDWKDISMTLNCEWLKKATNRKILGLKVPKEAQYIIKFLVSTTYIFNVPQRQIRDYYIDDFHKVFNIDLDAYKIKKDEIDKITKRLFTIETENYFEQSDVQSDVGAKILNESELQIANLNKEDFYQEAIKLPSPTQVSSIQGMSANSLNNYTNWYNSKIELICESEEHNAFIPSEIWQYLKYVQEQNLVFGQRDNQWNKVTKIEMQNGEYVGLDYYDNVVKSNIDERIVNFLRFYNFVSNTRFSTRESGTFDSNSLPTNVLRQIFSSFKVPYISSLGCVSSLMDTTDQAYIDLSAKYQKAYDFFNLNLGSLYFNDLHGNLYSIDTSSAFFEEVDFNKENVNLEFKYLSKEQLGDDDIAIVQYIDKVFCDRDNMYEDNPTYSKIGLPSAIELVLGEEVKAELMDVFKTPVVSRFRKAYDPLDTNKFYPSTYSNQFPPSFDDLKEDNGGYKANGGYIPIGWVKFLLFAKEHLQMENVQTDNALISYFYDGSPEFAKDLRIENPYEQINDMLYSPRRAQVGVYDSTSASYQISVKIGALTQAKLVKKKNKFEEEISSLTQLLQVFGNDEPLKQNIIYNKIARVRKEQEAFIQKRYYKGDLSKLLQLYADGQKLGGQRDLANVVQCGMTTPTGEPSELDLMQYKLVRTPEFKKWFGDWEEAYVTKDYSAVSKAINPKTAEPIVCYHGKGNMRAEATYFNLTGFPVKYVGTNLSYSIWFARNRTPISVVYEFYAKLINPIDLSKARLGDMTPIDFKALVSSIYGYDIKTRLIDENRPQRLWQILRGNPLMLKELRDNTNYDGLIIYEDNPSDVLPSGEFNSTLDYIVFSNMQLKSADNRNSTFLIDSPDFRFDDGGLIKSDI